MFHTIQVDNVIPILSPAVTEMLVGMFPKYVLLEHYQSVNCVSCLVTNKTWLNEFHSLVLITLYGLMTGLFCTLWGFY